MTAKELSNHEIVTLVVYLLGGEAGPVDTEDVAIKANALAPGRYIWKKFPDQVNLEIIRVYLSDAKKPGKGAYVIGSGTEGWLLTSKGLAFAKKNVRSLESADLTRAPLTIKERSWRRSERVRILASEALAKYKADGPDSVTREEIEAMFRVDPYVVGKARERKVVRTVNTFGDDPEIGRAIRDLAKRLQEEAESDG